MPTLALPINDSRYTTAWKTILAILQRDPVLDSVIKTWRVWVGEQSDAAEAAKSELPWARLSPGAAAQGHWESEGQHQQTFLVRLEIMIAGTRATDLMNLWGAFEAALFPQDDTQRSAITQKYNDAGLMRPILMQPAISHRSIADFEALYGDGGLSLPLYINT